MRQDRVHLTLHDDHTIAHELHVLRSLVSALHLRYISARPLALVQLFDNRADELLFAAAARGDNAWRAVGAGGEAPGIKTRAAPAAGAHIDRAQLTIREALLLRPAAVFIHEAHLVRLEEQHGAGRVAGAAFLAGPGDVILLMAERDGNDGAGDGTRDGERCSRVCACVRACVRACVCARVRVREHECA